mmetsp:Transcript_7594/g.24300  ORF Transcript_7594/g.24300 Transcript_7594/m.24300 type:complete len:382 (+) Transcript_7594:1482-2627(+)
MAASSRLASLTRRSSAARARLSSAARARDAPRSRSDDAIICDGVRNVVPSMMGSAATSAPAARAAARSSSVCASSARSARSIKASARTPTSTACSSSSQAGRTRRTRCRCPWLSKRTVISRACSSTRSPLAVSVRTAATDRPIHSFTRRRCCSRRGFTYFGFTTPSSLVRLATGRAATTAVAAAARTDAMIDLPLGAAEVTGADERGGGAGDPRVALEGAAAAAAATAAAGGGCASDMLAPRVGRVTVRKGDAPPAGRGAVPHDGAAVWAAADGRACTVGGGRACCAGTTGVPPSSASTCTSIWSMWHSMRSKDSSSHPLSSGGASSSNPPSVATTTPPVSPSSLPSNAAIREYEETVGVDVDGAAEGSSSFARYALEIRA